MKRNGNLTPISPASVVVGDIVSLEPKNDIPADGLLISGSLKTDESCMTGESELVNVDVQKFPFVMAGTVVSEGNGLYLVTAVGNQTSFGKTAEAM